jgi:hypothetical protein
VDRRINVVEVDRQLAELVLGLLDLACDLGALRDQTCEDVRVCHIGRRR